MYLNLNTPMFIVQAHPVHHIVLFFLSTRDGTKLHKQVIIVLTYQLSFSESEIIDTDNNVLYSQLQL